MALATLSEIKTLLGISGTAEDARLTVLLAAADAAVKNYCHQALEQATFTEFYDTNGKYTLTLRQRPVASITSVKVDTNGNYGTTSGSFDSTTLLTEGVDYALRYDESGSCKSGILARINGVWPYAATDGRIGALARERGYCRGCVKVVYVAGYATTPDPVKLAVADVVAFAWQNAIYGGDATATSKSLGDYSYSLSIAPMTGAMQLGSVRQLLAAYRDVIL